MVFGLLALVALGCEPPARSHDWRASAAEEHRRTDAAVRAAAAPGTPGRPAGPPAHTLRIHLDAEPHGLDPLADPDLGAWWIVMGPVVEPVLTYAAGPPGRPGVLGPGVASVVRSTPGGELVRLAIREGARFSDGRPVTSVDLQYSIDVARGRARVPTRIKRGLAHVTSVSLAGTRDVILVQARPNPGLLRLLADVPVVPATYTPGRFREAPIGSGPFKVASWEHGARIVLERDPEAWGVRPPPEGRVDRVELVIEPDGARALMLAVRGEIDVIPALAAVHHPAMLTAPGIKGDFLPLELTPPAFEMLALDASRPPFDDARVREAVSVAIDRAKIVTELRDGLARAIVAPVWVRGPIEGVAPPVPKPDRARAGALLGAAGWVDADGDGIRERAGTRLRTSLLAIADLPDDPEREVVLAALRSIGFLVDVLPGEVGFLVTRLRAGGYGAAIVSVRTGPGDDLAPLLGRGGKDTSSVATSAALDAALAGTLPTLGDDAERDAMARLGAADRVAELLTTEWPIVGLVAPHPVGLVHRRVRGLVPWGGWFALAGVTLVDQGASGPSSGGAGRASPQGASGPSSGGAGRASPQGASGPSSGGAGRASPQGASGPSSGGAGRASPQGASGPSSGGAGRASPQAASGPSSGGAVRASPGPP